MSEVVVRMEMPGSCLECRFFNKMGCVASGMMFPDWLNVAVRPKGCPILAVLPEKHGRLVDADHLLRDIEEYHVSDGLFQHWLELHPTIVPATEGGNHEAD